MSWDSLRGQGRGWDHRGVLLPLAYRLLRCLVSVLMMLVRSDLSKDAELPVLRHENQVLRRQHVLVFIEHGNRRLHPGPWPPATRTAWPLRAGRPRPA